MRGWSCRSAASASSRCRRGADRLAFAAPPLLRTGPVDEATLTMVVQRLRLDRADVVDAQWVDNGPGWVGRAAR